MPERGLGTPGQRAIHLGAVLNNFKSWDLYVSKIGSTLYHLHVLVNDPVKGQGFLPQASMYGFYVQVPVLSY